MARNRRPLSGIVDQYIQGQGESDLDNDRVRAQFMLYGVEALRHLQFDTINVVKSVNIPINKTLNIAELPNDYVDWVRIGVVIDCKFYSLGNNQRINFSGNYLLDNTGEKLLDMDGIELLDDVGCSSSYSSGCIKGRFNEPYYQSLYGGNYGASGDRNPLGEYRINFMDNRIQLSSNISKDNITLEYVADESMSSNPLVMVFAEDAVMKYIFWRAILRKNNVSASRIQMAERDFVIAKRKARAQFMRFSKSEALQSVGRGFSLTARF
jgi:hypothetical protein